MDKNVAISAEDCVRVDNYLFFISKEINVIFSLNIDNGEVNIVDSIPEEDILAPRLGAKIINWNNQLIFVPMLARKIWKYDMSTKEWKGYERKDLGEIKTGEYMFQAILFHDSVYMIGGGYPAIIRLDLLTDVLSYYEEPYDALKDKWKDNPDIFFRSDYVQIDNYIFFASSLDNMVLKFDMEKLDFEWFRVGNKDNRYSGIAWDGKNFWLAPRHDTPIVKWDGKDTCQEYKLPDVFSNKKCNFSGVICLDDKIVFPGFLGQFTVEISKDGKEELYIKKEQYNFYKRIDDDLLVKLYKNNMMELVYSNGKSKKYLVHINRDILTDYLSKKLKLDTQPRILYEENIINLDFFCKSVKDTSEKDRTNKDNVYREIICEDL